MLKSLFSGLIDTILPPRCLLSGEIVTAQGGLSPTAWAKLRFIGTPLCQTCGIPFEFDSGGDSTCALCLRDPPPFSRMRAALVYDDESRDLVLRFKHGDRVEGVDAFSAWMERAGAEMIGAADVIIPVPLHPLRLLMRRYNQSALLAQALAQRKGKIFLHDALRRHRVTPSQGKRGFRDRHKNVKAAFSVPPHLAQGVQGKNILLVDDVYTSGATVRECAKTLLESGALRVDVLTLMRVVRAEIPD